MKLYLAGPTTGIPKHNVPEFDRCAENLRSMGWEVISPADISRMEGFDPSSDETGILSRWDYARLFRKDVEAIFSCDGFAVMSGWMNSRGARVEAQLAAIYNKTFFDAETGESFETPTFNVSVS